MARDKHRKSKPKKVDHSQRMNRLKAKALAKVANQAWAGRQRYKSVALLTEAVRRDPKNPELLISLASAYGKQRFYDKAEDLLGARFAISARQGQHLSTRWRSVRSYRSSSTSRRVLPSFT